MSYNHPGLGSVSPLRTPYKGIWFASKVEAANACGFDRIGLVLEYEPEGLRLRWTCYLPDFYLPQLDAWLEIKGGPPTAEEFRKIAETATVTGKTTLLVAERLNGKRQVWVFKPGGFWRGPLRWIDWRPDGDGMILADGQQVVFVKPNGLGVGHRMAYRPPRISALIWKGIEAALNYGVRDPIMIVHEAARSGRVTEPLQHRLI
jgi:hypothetical protein